MFNTIQQEIMFFVNYKNMLKILYYNILRITRDTPLLNALIFQYKFKTILKDFIVFTYFVLKYFIKKYGHQKQRIKENTGSPHLQSLSPLLLGWFSMNGMKRNSARKRTQMSRNCFHAVGCGLEDPGTN